MFLKTLVINMVIFWIDITLSDTKKPLNLDCVANLEDVREKKTSFKLIVFVKLRF